MTQRSRRTPTDLRKKADLLLALAAELERSQQEIDLHIYDIIEDFRKLRTEIFGEMPFDEAAFYALLFLERVERETKSGVMLKQVMSATGLPDTTALRLVNTLEMEGCITSKPDANDARRRLVSLTEGSREKIRAFLKAVSRRIGSTMERGSVPVLPLARTRDPALHRPGLTPADEANSAGVMNPRDV